MQVDIRIFLGLMLGALGILLGGYGLVSDPSIYKISLGINVNLWAGGCMLAMGLLFLGVAYLGRRSKEASLEKTVPQNQEVHQ